MNNQKELYGAGFFAAQKDHSMASARIVLPILIDEFKPKSIVDVGCGVGTWLKEFSSRGICDFQGIDGSWVRREMLVIPEEKFMAADLTSPPKLEKRFSLAVSLEVAEHLPPNRAEGFVHFLTSLAPIIVFSAAVPNQGGTGHLNEQWQSYWAGLFHQQDYVPNDVIRQRIWNSPEVCYWYAQNLIVYAHVSKENWATSNFPMNVVHPRLFEDALSPKNLPPERVFRALPYAIKKALRKLLR